jgi:hypothetical protein
MQWASKGPTEPTGSVGTVTTEVGYGATPAAQGRDGDGDDRGPEIRRQRPSDYRSDRAWSQANPVLRWRPYSAYVRPKECSASLRGARPPVEARIYLTRSEIVSLVILSWITADRPLAAAVAALAETTLAMGLRQTR